MMPPFLKGTGFRKTVLQFNEKIGIYTMKAPHPRADYRTGTRDRSSVLHNNR